jgi:hypothetical protein
MLSNEEIYRRYAEMLAEMVQISDEHAATEPNCGAHPLCIEGGSAMAMAAAGSNDPGYYPLTVMVAVREMSRLGRERADAEKRLEIQRRISGDLTAELERSERRTARAEEEQQMLLGKIDTLEHQLAAAMAELTVWEESADCIAPAGLPVIEP